jgi:predicted ATPase/DNA-binding CsgD family transcriptional regulator
LSGWAPPTTSPRSERGTIATSAALDPNFNIPPQPTRLVDRHAELALLGTLLAREDVRLLTLTGPGGVGKTRLAIAAAEQVRESFPDGVWFVDLAPLANPALVLPTIARVVGVREQPAQDPRATLAIFMRDRNILLVADNLEHLLAAAPDLDALLTACPRLTVLVTSREPLHLRREQVVEVRPLPVPEAHPASRSITCLESVPTVALFVARAQSVDADFALNEDNAAAVAELSRRLEGLPLAVELAAARIRVLEPEALLARMEHRLALLRWDAPDLPPRHRTLHATLDWSYALLSPSQQALFRRLAGFVGGFTLDGAEAVFTGEVPGQDDGDGEALFYQRPAPRPHVPTVLNDLAALVDHSLVQLVCPVEEEPRYRMLETVREFGLEQLVESGEEAEVRRRHLVYFVTLAERLAEHIWLPDSDRVLARLDAEHDDMRAALTWAEAVGEVELGMRLARAMVSHWIVRGHLREGRGWLERALEWGAPVPSAVRARVLGGIGWLAQYQGDLDRAEAALHEGLAMAVAVGARLTEARAQNALAFVHLHRGRHAEAAAAMDGALALFQELEPVAIAGSFHFGITYARRGMIALLGGETAGAASYLEEAQRRFRATDHTWALSETLHFLGNVALERGDVAEALARYRESLDLAQERGDRLRVANALDGVAGVAASLHQLQRAARLHGAAAALREQLGAALAPWDQSVHERALAAARAALGSAAFDAAQAAGAALPLDRAAAEAMADPEPTEVSSLAAGLTAREAEVLRLLAEGLSDREIADALALSPRTVGGHVTHLLGKLGVDSRTAAVAYALRHRLVDSSPPPSRPA